MLYQIANWQMFENNKSRERDRCSFVCLPNKQDGLGLARILAEPDGGMVFGLWTLLVQACSRHANPRAGWVTIDGQATGTPWTPDDLALKWRRPVSEVDRMLEVASRPNVGWLISHGAREVSPQCPGREGKGKEGEGSAGAHATPLPPSTSKVSKTPDDDGSEGDSQDSQPTGREGMTTIREMMAELLLPLTKNAENEWLTACDLAGCRSDDDRAAFMRWTVNRLRREMTVRFARDVEPLLRAWGEWGRADYRRLETLKAERVPPSDHPAPDRRS